MSRLWDNGPGIAGRCAATPPSYSPTPSTENEDVVDRIDRVSELLHEAAENHHRVYRISDGADEDWATWYADWLTRLSELPEILSRPPVRSELTYCLVALDKEYTASTTDEPWERVYAARLLEQFS
jgi:hypothetical protein